MANTNRTVLTAADGFILGVDMVREMLEIQRASGTHFSPCAIEQEFRRPGEPQQNVVGEYLQRIRESGNEEVQRGFASFLTEYISTCTAGCIPDLEPYEKIPEKETI